MLIKSSPLVGIKFKSLSLKINAVVSLKALLLLVIKVVIKGEGSSILRVRKDFRVSITNLLELSSYKLLILKLYVGSVDDGILTLFTVIRYVIDLFNEKLIVWLCLTSISILFILQDTFKSVSCAEQDIPAVELKSLGS